jgi:hypothetical protein
MGLLPSVVADFEHRGETFKAKPVRHRKEFNLADLPEAFRLLTSAGRNTFHQLPSTKVLAEILAKSASAQEALRRYQKLDWESWIEALGPKGWESLCLGYLILEHGFLPTGLGVGCTLPDFDLVGRATDGRAILAQCKKDLTVHALKARERLAFDSCKKAKRFLFAYGGGENVPKGVRVVNRDELREWFRKTPSGRHYRRLLMRSV